LEASKCLLKEEALRGTWKGEGFAIQSCSFPSCCAIQSKSEVREMIYSHLFLYIKVSNAVEMGVAEYK
jgi:hypothetical protein